MGVRSKRRTRTAKTMVASPTPLRLTCIFFKSEVGNEPVRDWLRQRIPAAARRTIGTDIKTVQATWPIDKPLVDSLGDGLREVRSTHDKVEYRVIFMLDGNTMVLLHGFVKTTQKTRKIDIEAARKRKALRERAK
jgi:phage-related protein